MVSFQWLFARKCLNSIFQLQDISPPSNSRVRRANSAKSTTSTIKAHRNNLSISNSPSTVSKRSLSQPSLADVAVRERNLMENLDDLKHIDDEVDDEETDTDSLNSTHEGQQEQSTEGK